MQTGLSLVCVPRTKHDVSYTFRGIDACNHHLPALRLIRAVEVDLYALVIIFRASMKLVLRNRRGDEPNHVGTRLILRRDALRDTIADDGNQRRRAL